MDTIPESLPLFKELEPVRGVERVVRHPSNPHLRAAQRLSRAVRQFPDYSEEQTLAGQAICRHLIALLEEAALEPTGATRKDG